MEWGKSLKESLKKGWERFGAKLLLGMAFLLVGVLCFEAGLLQKSLAQPSPVIIRVAEPVREASHATFSSEVSSEGESASPSAQSVDAATSATCQLVGSKNSNKYHHPLSHCAKQIKPENRRCFASIEDAKTRGYLPGCLTP